MMGITTTKTTKIRINADDIKALIAERFAPGRDAEVSFCDDFYETEVYVEEVTIVFSEEEVAA